jgi:hypothetical protein
MAIEDGHEDRDAAARAGRRFGDDTDGQDGAVGRRDNGLFASLRRPLRISEELNKEEGREAEDRGDNRVAEPQEEAGC